VKKHDAMLVVETQSPDHRVEKGDILIFGEGEYSVLDVPASVASDEEDGPTIVDNGRFKGVLVSDPGKQRRQLIFFHEPDAELSDSEKVNFNRRERKFFLPLVHPSTGSDAASLDFVFRGRRVPAVAAATLLSSMRLFVLAAAEEKYLLQPSTGKRRSDAFYELFEPFISVAAASVDITFHPSKHEAGTFPLKSGGLLQLAAEVLRLAATEGSEAALHRLSREVFSSKKLLEHLLLIARSARSLELELRTSGQVVIKFDEQVERTLAEAVSIAEPRELERRGVLYAIDTKRRWIRVAVTIGATTEDWTIRYNEDQSGQVAGSFPRDVHLSFKTSAARGSRRGTGQLISVLPPVSSEQ
jgi:hypothetical protein